MGKRQKILILIVLTLLFLFLSVALMSFQQPPQNSDFFTFWLSGHLFLEGENPYNSVAWVGGHHLFGATWIPNQKLVYPLPIGWLFASFALLPFYNAFLLWDTLSIWMIVGTIVLLWGKLKREKPTWIFPIFASILIYRPMVLTLINGQISAYLTLILASITYLL